MAELNAEEVMLVAEAFQQWSSRTGCTAISDSNELHELLESLCVRDTSSDHSNQELFDRARARHGARRWHVTFDDLIWLLQDIKGRAAAPTRSDEDSMLAALASGAQTSDALVKLGLPPSSQAVVAAVLGEARAATKGGGTTSRAAELDAAVRSRSQLKVNAADAADDTSAISLSATQTHTTESATPSALSTLSLSTRTRIAHLGHAARDSATTGVGQLRMGRLETPYTAIRKSATVVSSGATSALAGTLHAEVMLMRQLRAHSVREKIATPLPLPSFYGRHPTRGGAATSTDSVATDHLNQTTITRASRTDSQLRSNTESRSFSTCVFPGDVAPTTIDTSALSTRCLCTVADYTASHPEATAESSGGPYCSTHAPQSPAGARSPSDNASAVFRGSLRRTHAAIARSRRRLSERHSPVALIEVPSVSRPLTSPLSQGPRQVPSSRIVRRIIDVDRTVFQRNRRRGPQRQRSAPATISRLLRAIDVEATDLYLTSCERARLKSPYLMAQLDL